VTATLPRTRHKLASLAVRSLAGVVILAVLCGGLLAARLSREPITISGLGPLIADVLDARFGHRFAFRLGATALVGGAHFPTFTIDTLSLTERSGRTILSAPRAEVSIDPFALLLGIVTPRRLDVFDVALHLSLLPDGSLALPDVAGAPPPPVPPLVTSDPPPGGAPLPGTAVATAEAGDVRIRSEPAQAQPVAKASALVRAAIDFVRSPDSPIGAIDRIGIARGRLVIDDRAADRTLIFHGLDIAFVKSAAATKFDLAVDGPNGRWSASGSIHGALGAERGMTLAVHNLSLDEVLLASGARSLGADSNMPASLEAHVGLGADGTLREAGGQFTFGAGYLRFDDPEDEPMMIDAITGGFRVEPATGRIVIEPSRLVAGTTRFAVGGTVIPPSQAEDAWTIHLAAAEPGVAGPERPGQVPVRIEAIDLAARLVPGDKKLVIDRFAFSGPDCGFALAGTIDWTNGPRVRLGASVSPTPVTTVLRLWPSFMVAPARAWLLAHATEGMFQSGTLQVHFDAPTIAAMRAERAPPDDSVLLDFTISGGGLELLPGVPPLRGFDGKGHVTGRTAAFLVTNGMIDLGGNQSIAVPEGSFHIADADLKPLPATVTAHVAASVETIATLLGYERLKPYARLPMDLTTMRGQVAGTLALGVTLDPAARPEDNPLEIHATIAGFSAERVLGAVALEAGSATVDIARSGLRVSGRGQILATPATFEVTQAGVEPARAAVKLTLDDSFLSAHGFGADQGIGGPIGASIVALLGAGDSPTAEVELDLAKATLDLPGLSKPGGRPGRVAFSVAVNDRTTVLERVSVDVAPAVARGSVELGSDLALLSARFPIVKLSPGDDMKIEALRVGDAVKVLVRGSAIDAKPFLKSLLFAPSERRHAAAAPGAEAGAKEVEVDVRAALLTGYNRAVVSGAEVRLVKRGEELRQLTIAGRFGRDPLSANLTGAPAAPIFNLSTDDAGSLLGFLDLYKHMEGGRLSVGIRLDRGAMDGLLIIRDFVLRDEPALRRLVDEGVPADAGGRQQKIDAGAVGFSNLQVRFQRAGNRLGLSDGTMSGAAIGLTVDGWLDYVADRVDVTGTFIPAFALNNMFSKIPLFGTLLGGGTNEGLLGVNYRLEGLASAPTLSINPLSIIAPGIFRKIFGVGNNAFPTGAAQ
jgi:hypothetical protein